MKLIYLHTGINGNNTIFRGGILKFAQVKLTENSQTDFDKLTEFQGPYFSII